MDATTVREELDKPLSQRLLHGPIPARLAYTALDGDPRAIPLAFHAEPDHTIVIGTVVGSAKVRALRANPRVAITIDTEHFPPHMLLIRGAATVEIVEGVFDEYLRAAAKIVSPDRMPDWEAGVRHLYQRMAKIVIRPDWAKLIDFETTVPKAVADLVAAGGHAR